MLIDIEGTDGCGKKTQTIMLYNYLTSIGKKCKLISFPNYESESSNLVKMYLSGKFGEDNNLNAYQISVMYAIDRVLTMKQVDVNDYDYIIFDRYTPSNMIYQTRNCKSKKETDALLDWLEDFEYNKMALPIPDITIFLDVPIEYSIAMMKQRQNDGSRISGDILENEEVQRQSYDKAKYIAHKMEWKTIRCVQNGNFLSKEIIHEKIKRIIKNDY